MASYTATLAAPVLKELFHDRRIADLTMQKNAFWATLRKREDLGGEGRRIVVKRTGSRGRSHAFASSQNNAYPTIHTAFTVTYNDIVDDYGIAEIDGKTLALTRNNRMAFVEALDQEVSGTLTGLVNNLAREIWHDGNGSRGQIGSTANATATAIDITMKDTRDARYFEVNDVVVASDDDGSSTVTLRSAPATGTVTAVNRSTGVVTLSGDFDDPTDWVADDYLWIRGDVSASGGTGLKGIPSWIPVTAPTSTAFYTVDRSVDPTRLAGHRADKSSKSLENALLEFASEMQDLDADPEVIWVSPPAWNKLAISMGSRVTYEMMRGFGSAAHIGFKAIVLTGNNNQLKVMADRHIKNDRAYFLKPSTWVWDGVEKTPHIIMDDGLKTSRKSDSDGIELRAVWRGVLECDSPHDNGVCTIAT